MGKLRLNQVAFYGKNKVIKGGSGVKKIVLGFVLLCLFLPICHASSELANKNDQDSTTISQQNDNDDCQNGSCNLNEHTDHN